MNNIKLMTNSNIRTEDGREFTRLMGGFGENKPMFTSWQAAELLGLGTRDINRNIDRNIDRFEHGIDIVDLKSAVPMRDSDQSIDFPTLLIDSGLSQSKLNATKKWLAFSYSGMMKLVKIATTKESWAIYDNFLEDYFQTKAENQVMKSTIEEEIEELIKQKAFFMGMVAQEEDELDQIKMMKEYESVNKRITKLEKSLTKEETIKELQPKLHIADKVLDTKSSYDIGTFAKILEIDGIGRNNMFKWLKGQEILMNNNTPYQKHAKYFKVIPVQSNGYTNYKTLLKPNGIEYIVKRLIEDGQVITKSVDDVLLELKNIA